MVDLHVHSAASDGSLSPSNLVALAAGRGVAVLALTDHDTLSGLAEAEAAALQNGITLVRGVELNIDWPTGEFHLLGLGLERASEELLAITEELRFNRADRNAKIMDAMRADGYDVSLDELCDGLTSDCVGRPHFADYFMKKKLVKNRQQAFDNFLAKGRPYYIGRKGAELDMSVAAIKKSGGLPVLAHPLSLYLSWGKLPETLAALKQRGIAGLEAWHPGAREADCRRLELTARELGFFVTAGSDFHGEDVRADRKIGRTAGNIKIDDRFWFSELLPALEAARQSS